MKLQALAAVAGLATGGALAVTMAVAPNPLTPAQLSEMKHGQASNQASPREVAVNNNDRTRQPTVIVDGLPIGRVTLYRMAGDPKHRFSSWASTWSPTDAAFGYETKIGGVRHVVLLCEPIDAPRRGDPQPLPADVTLPDGTVIPAGTMAERWIRGFTVRYWVGAALQEWRHVDGEFREGPWPSLEGGKSITLTRGGGGVMIDPIIR